jgi:hypothetical protein
MQVDCIKALISESADRFTNKTDPHTQLYLLTADKLVLDVACNRLSAPAARIELQRALIGAEAGQQAAREAGAARAEQLREARADATARRQAEAEARERADHEELMEQAAQGQQQAAEERAQQAETDQRQALAQQLQAQQQQAHLAAVAYCVQAANARLNGFMANIVPSRCEANPNYYATLPNMQHHTANCQTTGLGSGMANSNCTIN